MSAVETSLESKAEQIRAKFRDLLDKTNKEHPRQQDVKALAELLNGNKSLELWRDVFSAAQFAELVVIENSPGSPGIRECWKHRLPSLRKELGYSQAPLLEKLLIQNVVLCWLRLSLVEITHSSVMKQSISLSQGLYWDKRLTASQRRFTRACETLTRVRKLSRNTPALQLNIAASGGQQVNVSL